ncbi:MAG: ABC transporter ATP-binding protein/permease [Oscillospiraceae bacterium]|nr:ABC transporter ATP-binding protein/permease [Oscillospiraceae bacterium]
MGPPGAPPHAVMNVEKAKNFKATLKTLFAYLSPYKIALAFIFAFAAGSTAFAIVGPKILGNATTELFSGLMNKLSGGAGINFSKIGRILLTVLVLYVTSALFSYVQGWLMTNVAQKLTYNLRKDLSEKIHRMPFKFFDSKNHGETLSIITNDIDTLSQSLNQSVTQMITSIVSIVGVFAMMLSIDVVMTLVALIIVPVSLILISVTVKISQKHFKNQQEYLGHVNGQIEEVFGAQNIVRAFNAEERVMEQFDKDNGMLYRSAWRSQAFSGLMMPIMTFVGNLGYVAVAIIGGYFTIRGRINVGDIQAFIQYTRQFTQPMGQIAQVSGMVQSTVAAAERVFEFLGGEEETDGAERERAPIPPSGIAGDVEFKNARFGYDEGKIIINDFSAKIDAGRKIAIVGPTGAGKTTIIKLLMRFYDVNGGSILVDGRDLRDYDRREIRSAFGMVLQDTWLFNGTIMENIRYGRRNGEASDDEVIAAAKAAHAHHFIKTLPGGYDMELNEEVTNVSQGQKQLLTIARAVLADPKILILDEATSSVDTLTETRIQKAMDDLMRGRTSFIIAHRLSTIKNADLILVMRNGDIAEQGGHDELIAKNGFYAELYNSQFEKAV